MIEESSHQQFSVDPKATEELCLVRESKPNDMDNYNVERAIEAWDQIGKLSSEVASSVMAKQASAVCERFREENEHLNQANKRRKLEIIETTATDPNIVSSDEESHATQEPLSDGLSNQVDRMGRMSKIIMEIERCHRLLRAEMLAMEDNHFLEL